jgi:hypothetical protein
MRCGNWGRWLAVVVGIATALLSASHAASAADWSVALQLAPLGLELSAEHARFILTF